MSSVCFSAQTARASSLLPAAPLSPRLPGRGAGGVGLLPRRHRRPPAKPRRASRPPGGRGARQRPQLGATQAASSGLQRPGGDLLGDLDA